MKIKNQINQNNYKVIGIGVDIENITRFSNLKYEENYEFYHKIFSDNEIEYCLKKKNPYPHFTVRFAGKESVIKALLSQYIIENIKEINILKNSIGVPSVKIKNLMEEKVKILITLSHTKENAIAFTVGLKNGTN